MIIILWEYVVRPEGKEGFERRYGQSGDWAKLFQEDSHFLGTRLLMDPSATDRYVTIDRWEGLGYFEEFKTLHAKAYETLDQECAALTVSERRIGTFTVQE